MKRSLKGLKKRVIKMVTGETPNKGIVAGEKGYPGKHTVIEAESYLEGISLAFEPELDKKSDTTTDNEEITSEASQREQESRSDSDSDSGVDLSGSKDPESPINTSISSESANYVEEIADDFNPLIEKYNSVIKECNSFIEEYNPEISRLKKLQVKKEYRIKSASFSSSIESLSSILTAAEETNSMQSESDSEDELNEKKPKRLQAEQEPLEEQIAPKKTARPANEETLTKKQLGDRNPNITLAICCLAACCFIAAAVMESAMLYLIGAALLITAMVIEWKKPSRELTSPSSSPFISGEVVAKT